MHYKIPSKKSWKGYKNTKYWNHWEWMKQPNDATAVSQYPNWMAQYACVQTPWDSNKNLQDQSTVGQQ